MSNRDPIDNLRYFAGRICTIHTRPGNWKLDQQQNLDYFMGLVETIDPMGLVVKNTINGKKTYVFLESVIAIAEESVHDNVEDLNKAVEEYDSKKAEILKSNPNLVSSKPARASTPPPPPSPCSSGGCGSSSFMDINSITQIAGQAREKLKGQSSMRRLCMDLVRCTDGAAIAASEWIGTGEKELADKAATDAFRERLNKMPFRGQIVIGEGEKDRSYGLFAEERVGTLRDHRAPDEILKPYDIAIDPIEGTRPTVTSGPEAISVIALAESGAMLPIDGFYALKLAYGPELAASNSLSVADPIERTVELASGVLGKPVSRIVVCILDRPRHKEIIDRLRTLGCRIKLIRDCDVSGGLATCLPDSGVDLLYGVGGAPEAVITACAMKCLRGGIQVKLCKGNGEVNPDSAIFDTNSLVKGDCVFAATGITNGSLLEGVRFAPRGAVTSSVFMRSESGTIRWVKTEHGN